MYRYNIYIMKHLASAAALVTVSLTSIIWLTQALRFIDFIVSRGISFGSFLELTLLLVPSLLLFVLPFALLCAVLYVYYRLMMDSEILVLASAGLSRFQLAKPAFNVAVGFTALAYAISLWLLPVSYREFKDMQLYLRDNYASLLLQEDVFNSPVDGLTVFIRERDADGILHGIIVHDSRDETKPPITMMAEEGRLEQTPQGPRFMLYHGNRQTVEDGKLSFLNFDQYALDINFYAAGGHDRMRQPEEMYLNELLFPDATGEEAARLVAEGHNRITWPLFCLGMTLFGVSVLLSGEFNRRGQWQRVTAVVLLSGLSLSASVGLLNLSVHQPWMLALMYANVALLIGVSIWLLGREPRRSNNAFAIGVA
jgi:lipopolysaccharide export system permease protein